MTNATVCVEDINSAILSADDLISLRKPHDLSVLESFHEKGYIPTEADENHVVSLLKDQKKMLDQKCVARIADLIQAEWNADSNRAVTMKLKGKRQHMGISIDGKISLSPQEAIFLLENGNLELRLNDVPLSTEGAYSKVLSEDLSLEKYQVYSHLSHLGYVVVQHQKDVDLVQKEKLHALRKCQCKKKRKRLEAKTSSKKVCPSKDFPLAQRTISPCELSSDTSLRVSPSHSNAENSFSDLTQKKLNEALKTTIDVSEETSTFVNSLGDSIEQVPCTSSSVRTDDSNIFIAENINISTVTGITSVDININDERTDIEPAQKSDNSGTTQLTLSLDGIAEHLKANPSSSTPTNSSDGIIRSEHTDTVNAIHGDKEVQDERSSDNVIEVSITSENSTESSKEISDVREVIIECSDNKNVSNFESLQHSRVDEITITDDEKSCAKNGADAAIFDSKSSQKGIMDSSIKNKRDKNITKSCVNVFKIDDDTSDESDTSSDSDVLYVDELEHGESAQSCDETNEDSVQSLSVNEAVEVDDVMILQVNRKEVEPLAVINLSSDEDNQSEKDASDDEVLILEESSTVKPSCKEQSSLSASSKLKREGCGKVMLKMERNGPSDNDWSFPNVFRKRVVCLPRPPAILLPFNAAFSREAYTVDTNMLTGPNNYYPTAKLWNSYKDLQQRMYSFKNEAGLNCDYPRGFLPISSQPHTNLNPFSSQSSPNPSVFQNNLLPQSDNRFSLQPEERNFLPHMAQASNFSCTPPMLHEVSPNGQFPMGGLIPNHPPINANGSPFLLGSPHLQSSPQQDLFSIIEDSKQNVRYQGPNMWMNTGRLEQNFHSSPNSWRTPGPNDESFRSTPNIWMNPPHNEGFGSSSNLRMNRPCNQGSFGLCPDPWINPLHNENYRSSPNSFDFPRNPSNFQNNFSFQEPGRNFSNPWMQNWRPPWFQNDSLIGNRQPGNYQQNPMASQSFLDNPYPCDIPKFSTRVSSWNDIKSSTNLDTDKTADENQDGDEVQEVPIDIDEVLWSKEIHPLVRPGRNLSLDDVLNTLQITTSANLSTTVGFNERCLPDACNLQISFDVYMPGTIYKKTCPTVPNHRIVVTRSSDPFPKFSDIIVLIRKLKDNALLQFAVVDDGSITFYSFNNINLPLLLPHQ